MGGRAAAMSPNSSVLRRERIQGLHESGVCETTGLSGRRGSMGPVGGLEENEGP